jgi:hypothetical protein
MKQHPSIGKASPFPFLFIILFFFISCTKKAVTLPENNPSATVTTATTNVPVLAGKTNGFGNGANLQPSYYNNGNPNFAWSLMKQQSKIQTLRIEIDPSRVSVATAKSWITQARSNGYTNLICTFHEYGGSSNANDLVTAANWWKANYNTLGGNFTINLCNEWGAGTMTSNAFASAYNQAIPIVRQVYSGPIIIDVAGYGHETQVTAQAVNGTNGVKINDGNIILSNHIYPNGYSNSRNRAAQKSDLDEMASTGKPCMIGEFGNVPSGSCDWSGMVDYAKSKGWTVLAWCWNGDGLGMNMVSPAWSSNPSATSFTLSSYFNTVYAKL